MKVKPVTNVLLIILLSAFSLNVFSQNKYANGFVRDSNNVSIPLVNVTLLNNDTIVDGTITDFNGYYEFNKLKLKKYKILISHLGFEKDSTIINFSNQDTSFLSFVLKTSSQKLNEVLVEGSLIDNQFDKKVYTISKEEKDKTSTAFELAKNLPKIKVDLVNNTYQSIGGKSVKILVNGISSNEKDLLTMNPNDVYKIEYYDIIPSRFSSENVGLVINIITKSSIRGSDIFANVSSAVTTRFSDDYFLYRYNKKNNQISANYSLSYRDYNKRVNDELYRYTTNGVDIEKLMTGKNSNLKYLNHNLNLRFLNTNEKRTFKIDFNNDLFTSNKDNLQVITQNTSVQEVYSNYIDETEQYSPNLDIYFNKKLKNNQEFSANIVTTLFETNYSNSIMQEADTSTSFSYFSNITNSKRSIISEILYEKRFTKFNFSTGITGSLNYSDQKNNTNSNNTSVSSFSNDYYYFAEASGKKKKLSYNIGLGLKYNTFKSNELLSEYDFLAIRPRVYLGYDLSKNSNIRANTAIGQSSPTLSILSTNVIYIDSIFLSKGNSILRPYNTYYNSIEYSYTKSKFQFYFALIYNYLDKPFLPVIIREGDIFVNTYENYLWEKQYFPQTSITYKPFSDFSINLYYTLLYFENKLSHTNSLISHSYNGSLSYSLKSFTFDFIVSNNGKYLRGEYISKGESTSTLQVKYTKGNFSFFIGFLQPFKKSIEYQNELVENSSLERISTANIYDNGQMLYLKLNYYISFGKKPKEISQKLYNKDSDSGVFSND